MIFLVVKMNKPHDKNCDTMIFLSEPCACGADAAFIKMRNKKSIIPYLIPFVAVLIILIGLFAGCDVVKCYPEYDRNGQYIGFQCGGEF